MSKLRLVSLTTPPPRRYFSAEPLLLFPRLPFYFRRNSPPPHSHSITKKLLSLSSEKVSACIPMDSSHGSLAKDIPLGLDAATEGEYASQSILLQEFTNMSTIDKAWTFKSNSGSQVMFSVSQPNLLANKRKKHILSSQILKGSQGDVRFQWGPFPIEITGASTMVPSPSGSKLLIIRNSETESPTVFEIWGPSQLEKEFHIPHSIHGSVYTDGWFEGVSWNGDESLIAYVAEEPAPSKPTFGGLGYCKGGSSEKDFGNWKGQGDWEEDWGETYAGKRQPALFLINVNSGEVQAVRGIGRTLSVGQVVWAPLTEDGHQYLVFVGWPSDSRKLGIKYCYNRPCALYAVRAPTCGANAADDVNTITLTQDISSAFFPRFSLDGKFLVFLSAKCSVDSGAHSAAEELYRIEWPTDYKSFPSVKVVNVVPAVMCPNDGCFPGLYSSSILSNPWLSDGCTLILSSVWYSTQAILAVNVLSGKVSRLTPHNSNFSWNVLALDGDNVIAACSSPVDIPELKYGCCAWETSTVSSWRWIDVSSPSKCSEKVISLLSALQFSIMKIPVKSASENLPEGAKKPFESIFVSSTVKNHEACDPLIVIIHGGPHTVSLSSYSKSLAFLASTGFSLLIVNYRGSLGFGEEALQSLPGKAGSQDVNDVLAAIDHVIDAGLADPAKIFVLGGSHGGFLTTHLIGQAPDKFVAAAARNPVCNIALMVGTTDIPDWCYVEAYGSEGLSSFTEAPSLDQLSLFHGMSPISHLSKVKTPTLFLLGARDLRVPVSNGLQYARALKEKGVDVKVIVFPDDVHGIDRPQSDFESFLNIGVWFKKYCK